MIFIIFIGVLFASLLAERQSKASVVMCHSFTCVHNRRARCTRKEVTIYDNTVIGLCLNHSDTMKNRILEPMDRVVERGKPNPQMTTKIMQAQGQARDSELIKSPKAFATWIKKYWL